MWQYNKYCQSKARLEGKTVVITGANTGIGTETARDLYWRGARVILACRNLDKANAAAENVKRNPPSKSEREQFVGGPGEIIVCKLDLGSLASVRECAKHISTTESALHILINNAGLVCTRDVTEDGFEAQFGINHLGHFLLTLLLLPKMIQSQKNSDSCSRIVTVSSKFHQHGNINFDDLMSQKSYRALTAYNQSKLANILFARELSRRLKEANISNVNTYSLHPGVIMSNIWRNLDGIVFRGASTMFGIFAPFIKNVEQGAQTTLHCAVDENAAKESGLYYKECASTEPGNVVLGDTKAARLWDVSMELVGLPSNNNLTEIIDQISKEYLK